MITRLLAIATLTLVGGCAVEAETVAGGHQAYRQNRVAEAERIFNAVVANNAAAAGDRAEASRELARIAWLIDRDAERAGTRLQAAARLGADLCFTNQVTSRVLAQSGQAESLAGRVRELAASCSDPREADVVRLHALNALLDRPTPDPSEVNAAGALWAALSKDTQESTEGSRARLKLGLLIGDAAEAQAGWRGYFWLADQAAPQAVAAAVLNAAGVMQAGLATTASAEARLALVDLLIRAGFGAEARRFATLHGLERTAQGSPAWRKASAYWAFRDRAEALTLAAYRRLARGGKQGKLEPEMEAARAQLVSAAGLSGEPGAAVLRAYGLYGTVGNTGGYPSVHLGHAYEDRRETITQYGESAPVRLIVVDNMLSNGFESWLWDGSAAAGGWTAAGPVIVQVRSGYTSGPARLWRAYSDPVERRKLIDEQAELTRKDAAALQSAGVAYLPGLNGRLRLQVADQVGAAARLRGGELREAFLAEAWRASLNQSIFVHEGRHALDKRLIRGPARFNDANLEYRAKLSELALADYPRLALLNMNEPGIGGGTPHSKANARVLQAYLEWIRTNPGQIAGYDPNQAP